MAVAVEDRSGADALEEAWGSGVGQAGTETVVNLAGSVDRQADRLTPNVQDRHQTLLSRSVLDAGSSFELEHRDELTAIIEEPEVLGEAQRHRTQGCRLSDSVHLLHGDGKPLTRYAKCHHRAGRLSRLAESLHRSLYTLGSEGGSNSEFFPRSKGDAGRWLQGEQKAPPVAQDSGKQGGHPQAKARQRHEQWGSRKMQVIDTIHSQGDASCLDLNDHRERRDGALRAAERHQQVGERYRRIVDADRLGARHVAKDGRHPIGVERQPEAPDLELEIRCPFVACQTSPLVVRSQLLLVACHARLRRMRAQVPLLVAMLTPLAACQDYPFEARLPKRVQAKKITEVVATIVPTDILFLVDNSGSMLDQITELRNNVDLFVNELAKSENDFQVAIITPDIECNVPRYKCVNDCTAVTEPSCNAIEGCLWTGGVCTMTWRLGSYSCCSRSPPTVCADLLDVNGVVTSSTCDGGRLRAREYCSCPQHADKATCTADVANACSWQQGPRIFRRPAPEDQAAWAAEFKATITSLGTAGSSYEGGLEAVRRAVSCSAGVNCDDPLDKAVRDLNSGFVRPEADLVVILLSDEDDCSFADRNTYAQPLPSTDSIEQAGHICGPNECYAYYACSAFIDDATCESTAGCAWDVATSTCTIRPSPDCPLYNGDSVACAATPGCVWTTASASCSDELIEWADPLRTSAAQGLLQCGKSGSRVPRQANPPVPHLVDSFLDALAVAKGGDITRVRAAGIIGSVSSTSGLLGSEAAACVDSSMGPDRNCGCLAGTGWDPLLCAVTGAIGQRADPWPSPADPVNGGCIAMPGGRYMELLRKLAQRRVAAFARPDTLVDSICRAKYDQTMYDIVNSIILNNCVTLGEVPGRPEDLLVTLNGAKLDHVETKGTTDPACEASSDQPSCVSHKYCVWGAGGCAPAVGWSWRRCSQQICLEGGLRKAIGDDFQILMLRDGCQYLTTRAACENPENCCSWPGDPGPCVKR
jgi:hypothetical protein